jgi:hypothetical protein
MSNIKGDKQVTQQNNLQIIRVVSSSDAGCEWSLEEQLNFSQEVESHLSQIYPNVMVECEVVDRFDTKVFIYGKESPNGQVTHPEAEDDLIASIKAQVQEVWEQGNFWTPIN